jgi:hypothetical protein
MTPKEKCDELIKQFKPLVQFKMGVDQSYVLKMAKKCALISVDEILIYCSDIYDKEFMEKVKQEIELL